MQYTMIISRAMFTFTLSRKGKLALKGVRFLTNTMMQEKNDVLLISEENRVQFFLKASVPVGRLSREQFNFVAAAAKFFGHLPDKRMPVWLWSDSLEWQPAAVKLAPVAAMAC